METEEEVLRRFFVDKTPSNLPKKQEIERRKKEKKREKEEKKREQEEKAAKKREGQDNSAQVITRRGKRSMRSQDEAFNEMFQNKRKK